MNDLNDFLSWAEAIRCYERLKAVEGMNDFSSWAQGSRRYEQLKVVIDMNNSM